MKFNFDDNTFSDLVKEVYGTRSPARAYGHLSHYFDETPENKQKIWDDLCNELQRSNGMKKSSRKITDVNMIEMYNLAYSGAYDLDQIREAVKDIIENSRAPNQAILRKIPFMSKKQLMKVLSDYYLKGCGLGVI